MTQKIIILGNVPSDERFNWLLIELVSQSANYKNNVILKVLIII